MVQRRDRVWQILTLLSAIQECRDRALPDNSDFAGLAEVGNQEGFDVHVLDDRSREDDGFVRMVAPGRQTPSVGVRAASSSTRNSTSTSTQPSASTSTAPFMPQLKKTSKAIPIKVPVALKFGPPKGKKRDDVPGGSADGGGSSRVLGEARTGDPSPAAAASARCASPGPTPPTSRFSTPTPIVAVTGLPSQCSAVPAPAATIRPPSFNMDSSSPPAAMPVRRATSAQPASSTSIAVAPSAARAQSAVPSVGVKSTVLEVRHHVEAALSAMTAFGAAPFTIAAATPAAMSSAPTPSAVHPIQQCTSRASADRVGPGLPRVAEAHQPSVADSTLTPHLPDATTNVTPDATPSGCTPHMQAPSSISNASSSMPLEQLAAAARPPRHLTGSAAVPDLEQDAQVEAQRGNQKRKGPVSNLPAAKRRKTSGAEDWVPNALTLFRSTPLGLEWDALVRDWLQFEESKGFEGSCKLGSRHRPPIVADWIKRARKPDFPYEIKNLDKFVNEFNAWWRVLQPAWRLDDVSDLLRRDGEDWDRLRCSGVNGLVSVLAALFFWGNHAQRGAVVLNSRWLEALEDVSYAISKLI